MEPCGSPLELFDVFVGGVYRCEVSVHVCQGRYQVVWCDFEADRCNGMTVDLAEMPDAILVAEAVGNALISGNISAIYETLNRRVVKA